MNKHRNIFLSILFLFIFLKTFSQNSFDSSLNNAISVYAKAAGANSHLFNGSAYVDYDHRIQGNPFFESTYFETGSLTYDGVSYPEIKMLYDILNDDVVIKNYGDGAPLILVKEKITAFNLLGHNFARLVSDSAESGISTGIYDLLYEGTTTLIAKRKKIIEEKSGTRTVDDLFKQADKYYIKKENKYYKVNTKRSTLVVMKKNKSQILKYMHQNKIKFKKNKEFAMIKIAAYNDQLNSPK